MTTRTPSRDTDTTRSPIATADSAEPAPPAGHYSHVATHRGVAPVSGQLPLASDGSCLSGKPFEVRARQILDNVDACLRLAGPYGSAVEVHAVAALG
ncbi:Rid family hydrolase [Streptomyces sp. NPDC057099]|uniref:Rid family hydrolase n=1 Tax=Streptomyces sp. NPDC057099 TaxID=3346019 RepID=UPI003638FC0F